MIFFTIFATALNQQTIPKVIVTKMREKEFEVLVALEDGIEEMRFKKEYAVPEYVLHDVEVYVLEETEDGTYVRKATLVLGEKANGWCVVEEGINRNDRIVMACDRKLKDGMKVIRVEAKDW